MTDIFDEQPFYELMQQYRHAPSPESVIPAFEAVKDYIRLVIDTKPDPNIVVGRRNEHTEYLAGDNPDDQSPYFGAMTQEEKNKFFSDIAKNMHFNKIKHRYMI